MKYTKVRLFLVALASCAIVFSANTASAGFGWLHGGNYGSYGGSGGSSGGSSGSAIGYGSSGGSTGSYGSYGGSSGGAGSTGHGPGPLRRLAAHLHDHMEAKAARHAARAGYGSSGYGSSGGYYSGYGSSGSYSSSYGSSGGSYSYGSSGGAVSYGSSGGSSGSYVPGYIGASTRSASYAADLASYSASAVDSDSIQLSVAVPANALVFVNDLPTTSTGANRLFVSRGLQAGKLYKFEVRAELVGSDGQTVSETKSVTMTAGARDQLSFASLAGTPVPTTVTLNVPADAKVVLAGNATAAVGETRTYRTSQLKAGEQWDDYVIEVEHKGQVKRESLRLVAGDEISLTFNFDEDASKVASR